MTYDIMMYANFLFGYFLRIFGAQLAKGKRCPKILKIWEISYFIIDNGILD